MTNIELLTIKKSPTFNPDVTIPLLAPEPDAPCVNSDFLKNESDGITKSNTNPVTATPAMKWFQYQL